MSMATLPGFNICQGYYKLDDDQDFGPNNRDLSTDGGAPTYVASTAGGCVYGVTNKALYIDAGESKTNATAINIDTTDCSIGIWYWSAATTSGQTHTLVDYRYNSGGMEFIQFQYYQSGGVHYFRHRASNSTYTDTALTTYGIDPASGFHLWSCSSVASTNKIRYFIDGIFIHEETGGVVNGAYNQQWIGAYSDQTIPGHGLYTTYWSEARAYSDQDWRRIYAWFKGKLV